MWKGGLFFALTWREPCWRKRGTPECGGTVMLLNNMSILFCICILLVFVLVFVFLKYTDTQFTTLLQTQGWLLQDLRRVGVSICFVGFGTRSSPDVKYVKYFLIFLNILEPDLHLILIVYLDCILNYLKSLKCLPGSLLDEEMPQDRRVLS